MFYIKKMFREDGDHKVKEEIVDRCDSYTNSIISLERFEDNAEGEDKYYVYPTEDMIPKKIEEVTMTRYEIYGPYTLEVFKSRGKDGKNFYQSRLVKDRYGIILDCVSMPEICTPGPLWKRTHTISEEDFVAMTINQIWADIENLEEIEEELG